MGCESREDGPIGFTVLAWFDDVVVGVAGGGIGGIDECLMVSGNGVEVTGAEACVVGGQRIGEQLPLATDAHENASERASVEREQRWCEVVAECGDGPVGGDVENALRWLDGSGIVGDRTQSVQAGEPG